MTRQPHDAEDREVCDSQVHTSTPHDNVPGRTTTSIYNCALQSRLHVHILLPTSTKLRISHSDKKINQKQQIGIYLWVQSMQSSKIDLQLMCLTYREMSIVFNGIPNYLQAHKHEFRKMKM